MPAANCRLAAHATLVHALPGEAAFEPWLTRQDRQWSRPHVTVQDKVAPHVARARHADLSASLVPESVPAVGLGLWHDLGGPWAADGEFLFS